MFGRIIFYVFAGVQIIMISSRNLSSKVFQNSFWRPWGLLGLLGGSLCSFLFLAVFLFFIVSAGVQIRTIFSRILSPKVLLNSFWWPWRLLVLLGASLCSLLALEIRVFTSDSILVLAFKRLAGKANSRFHLGFYSDICFQALCWYSEFAFSPRIL